MEAPPISSSCEDGKPPIVRRLDPVRYTPHHSRREHSMFQPRSVQLLRTLTVFVVTGWTCAVAVRITDSGTTAQAALMGPTALRAAALGFAAGLPFAPLAAWSQQTGWKRLMQGRWPVPVPECSSPVYFWLWPPEWNAGHLATLRVFCKACGCESYPWAQPAASSQRSGRANTGGPLTPATEG